MARLDTDMIAEELEASAASILALVRDASLHITVARIAEVWTTCLLAGGRILLAGNGGSAADCQHIAAELVNRFKLDRKPLGALALTVDSSVLTAIGNDYGYNEVFVRQLQALANPGDVFVAISTSGKSENVLRAAKYARSAGLVTVGLTSTRGSDLIELCNVALAVPHSDTARVQEAHICCAHAICRVVEERTSVRHTQALAAKTT